MAVELEQQLRTAREFQILAEQLCFLLQHAQNCDKTPGTCTRCLRCWMALDTARVWLLEAFTTRMF